MNNNVQLAGEMTNLTSQYIKLFEKLSSYKNEEEAKECLDEMNAIMQRLEQIKTENLGDQ